MTNEVSERIKSRLKGPVREVMSALGIPPSVRPHLQDRLLRTVSCRLRALPRGGRLWRGREIVWTKPGVANLGYLEVPRPRAGQVLVRTEYTVVSPGTERAFLGLAPGLPANFPSRPGYSGAGTILEVGRGVQSLKPGDRVACSEVRHATLGLLPAERVFVLNDALSLEEAAFVQLLVIAQEGVRRGRINRDARVAVFGAGLIGQLACGFARSFGAEHVVMVAASDRKRAAALASGAHDFVALNNDLSRLTSLEVDVAFEVTGTPDALPLAAQTVREGGAVVLLGSTRGINRSVDFDDLLRRNSLSLIGAHISGVPESPTGNEVTFREAAEQALERLASGDVQVRHLITHRIDPRDAESFYRRLCLNREDVIGAIFEWKHLPDSTRARRCTIFHPVPDVWKRGRAFDQAEGAPSLIRARSPLLTTGVGEKDAEAISDPMGFALIGCGGMGARHAQALRDAPNADLVVAMDVNQQLARELAGAAMYTTSVEEALCADRVEAVLIAAPNHLHASLAIQAAEAGKHVIVEKPLANTLAEAREVIRACERAGVALSVGYSFRYASNVAVARRFVEKGGLGRLTSVEFSCYLDKPVSYWQAGYTGRTYSDWRTKKETAGGGILIMNMSHQLDQLRYIVRDELAEVFSVTGILDSPAGVEVEDVVSVAARFRGGALASIFGTACSRGLDNLVELRVCGDAGSMILDSNIRVYTTRYVPGIEVGRWHVFDRLPPCDVHKLFISRFADAVRRGESPDITGADGFAIQAWMDAIYRAAREGTPLSVEVLST